VDVIEQIDRFLRDVYPDQRIPPGQKVSAGKKLLQSARKVYAVSREPKYREALTERMERLEKVLGTVSKALPVYPTVGGPREKVLGQAISWLRTRNPQDVSQNALAKAKKYLADLEYWARPPTPEEKKVILELKEAVAQIASKVQLPWTPVQKLAVEKKLKEPPPIIGQVIAFREEVSKFPPLTEKSLRERTYQARELVGKLKTELLKLSREEEKVWRNVFARELKALQELHGKWLTQLEKIRKEEEKARTYAYQEGVARFKKEKYLRAKEIAQRRGAIKSFAVESANSLDTELGRVVTFTSILMEKAEKEKNPDILDTARITRVIANAERLASGILPRVPILLQKRLKDKINLLKFKLRQVENLKRRLTLARV